MRKINGNVAIERTRLPEHPEQAVDQTVKRMAEIAYGEYGSRSPKIRAAAIDIVRAAHVPEKDYYGEIVAVHEWIKKNIRYVRDPVNQETLSHPEETLFNSQAGDCDDMVVLESALLGAIGIKSHPVVVGMQPGMYSHVYLRATVPPGRHRKAGEVINLDPIMKQWPAGREAPAHKVRAKKTYKQLEAMMLNGNDDVCDINDGLDTGSNLGAYAVGPSYLDDEFSGAQDLLVTTSHTPDITHDLVLSNTPKAVQSKEGIDGMFGMGMEVVSTVPAGFDALHSRGPMVSHIAAKAHRPLEEGRHYVRKRYEGGEMEARMRSARGRAPVNAVGSPNRKVVTVNDGKKNITPENAPLTPQEKSDELDGLYGMIGEMSQRVMLAGLGAMDDPQAQEDIKRGATLSWFAKFRAKMAAARAAWLGQKAQHLAIEGRHDEAEDARKKAQTQQKLAKKAIEVGKSGAALEQAMAKTSPAARGLIARQQAELDAAESEEPVAAEADEKAALNKGLDPSKRTDTWYERRLKLLRTRRERLDDKIKKLGEQAKKVDRNLRRKEAMQAKRQEKIEAPVAIREMTDPAKRGRRNALRRTQGIVPAAPPNEAAPREGVVVPQQWEARDPNVNQRALAPAALEGLPTINTPIQALNSPLVQYGALAAGLYFMLKR